MSELHSSNQAPHVPSSDPYAVGEQPPHAYPHMAGTSRPGEDATGGLIPYNNPPALIAYYLGLFSIFPVLGILLAVPAFILGMMGLRRRRQNPAVRGSLHAWIGIVMGGLMTLVWTSVIGLIIVGLIASR